jgi:hypothetical protein
MPTTITVYQSQQSPEVVYVPSFKGFNVITIKYFIADSIINVFR